MLWCQWLQPGSQTATENQNKTDNFAGTWTVFFFTPLNLNWNWAERRNDCYRLTMKRCDHPLLIICNQLHLGLSLSHTIDFAISHGTFTPHIDHNTIKALFVVTTRGKGCAPILKWCVAASHVFRVMLRKQNVTFSAPCTVTVQAFCITSKWAWKYWKKLKFFCIGCPIYFFLPFILFFFFLFFFSPSALRSFGVAQCSLLQAFKNASVGFYFCIFLFLWDSWFHSWTEHFYVFPATMPSGRV